jgi:glycosyltransferase involved in cell wall biosynthesis
VIGVTVWEKDGVPPRLAENLKYVDGLIVPCRWNEQSFRHAGLATPLAVAPHAPLPSPAALDAPFEISGAQPGDFLFYTIGEWKDRKGLPLPVEAFCRAFTARDPVCLVVKTGLVNECRRQRGRWWWHVTRHIETSLRDLARIRARHQNPPRIAALTGSIPAAAIHSLHQRADCYVSLTRAEGWALGAYEAAFAGKPVMITGHGGQLDFLPQDLAYHVNYRLIDAQPQGLHDQHFRGKTWADPNLDHAVELMREVFSNPEKARLRGQGLQAFVNSTFQPAAIGHGILEFIRKVRVN